MKEYFEEQHNYPTDNKTFASKYDERNFAKNRRSFLSYQSSNNDMTWDSDIYKTSLKNFQLKPDSNIYEWMKSFSNHMDEETESNTEYTNLDLLLDRLSMSAKDKFKQKYNVDTIHDFAEIKRKVCEVLGGKKILKNSKNILKNLKRKKNQSMNDFYDEPFNAWIDFNYCKRVNEKRTRPDEDFIEYFTAALDKVDKKELKKKKTKRSQS